MEDLIFMLLAIVLSILATGLLIPLLRKRNYGQHIREEGNKDHYKKSGTPTMGGLAFTLVFIALLMLSNKFSLSLLFVLLYTFLYGLIGFIDDFEKISKNQNLGLNEKQKLILQFGIALVLVSLQYFLLDIDISSIDIPFLSEPINIGILAIPVIMFIVVGTVNATNLTDGLDGLLSSVSIPVFIAIYFMAKDIDPGVAKSSLIFAGVLLGFLVFNSNPASIFMGDTGSMAIGGAIVAMIISINKPIYLVFLGGVYVVEALSVILQTFSYKKFGKRIFKMAPIHHHFELKGFSESKIVASFTVVSVMLTVITLLII